MRVERDRPPLSSSANGDLDALVFAGGAGDFQIVAARFDGEKADLHHAGLVELDAVEAEGANLQPFDDDLVDPDGAEELGPDQRQLLAAVSLDLDLVIGAGFQLQRRGGQRLSSAASKRRPACRP